MKKAFVILLILVIAIIGFFAWWNNGLSAADPSDKQTQSFIIPKGSGLKVIASNLKSKGLIKSRIVFFLYARLNKYEDKIQAGNFKLSPSMNVSQVAENLTHGITDIWITIPEGKRATEIAQALKEKIPTYDSSWMLKLNKKEGYLFPDTYLIPKDATIDMILNQMTGNFEKKYNNLDISKTKLSKREIIILASLVEREAKLIKDKPIMAGILLNRLEIGMRLELCSTIQYIIGYYPEQKTWWKNGITIDDTQIVSSYNTYKNAGLPPGPIANPGIESLKAVVSPTDTDYLYWISDKDGIIHYAKTFEQHSANIKKFGL